MSYAVIGTSPFHDTSVAAGPFRSLTKARTESLCMEDKGWITEVVELQRSSEIGIVVNEEGMMPGHEPRAVIYPPD